MTRGVLLFAVDTETRSYTSLARFCAQKIKQHLQLPVALVTDKTITDSLFEHVITIEADSAQTRQINGVTEQWKNFQRYRAYELSPFDETILLDTDYICGSDKLLTLFDYSKSFMCHRERLYLGARHSHDTVEHFGTNLDMYWATVVYFKKSTEAAAVFTMMRMIQTHYDHYAKIYRFSPNSYRNDYAITIAINAVYGHCADREVEIPWSLVNVEFNTDIKSIDANSYQLTFEKYHLDAMKKFKITTYNQDLHILNKDAVFRMIE